MDLNVVLDLMENIKQEYIESIYGYDYYKIKRNDDGISTNDHKYVTQLEDG